MGVADIFDCRQVGQEEIQLVDGRCRVAFGQEFMVHEGQNVEEHTY